MAGPSDEFLNSCKNTNPKKKQVKCPPCPVIDCGQLCDVTRALMDNLSSIVTAKRMGQRVPDDVMIAATEGAVDSYQAQLLGVPPPPEG